MTRSTPSFRSLPRLALAFGLALVCGACGGDDAPADDDPTPGPGGVVSAGGLDGLCDAKCARRLECDSTTQLPTCEAGCGNELASVGQHLRADFVGFYTECVSTVDCGRIDDLWGLSPCMGESLAKIAPTATASDYCQAAVDKGTSCGQSPNETLCLSIYKMFDDASIVDAKACFESACDQYEECVRVSFGGFG